MRFTRDQGCRHLTAIPLIASASLVQVISCPLGPSILRQSAHRPDVVALMKVSLERKKDLFLLAGSPAEGGEGGCRRKGSLGGRAGAGRQQGSSVGGGHSAAAGGRARVGSC